MSFFKAFFLVGSLSCPPHQESITNTSNHQHNNQILHITLALCFPLYRKIHPLLVIFGLERFSHLEDGGNRVVEDWKVIWYTFYPLKTANGGKTDKKAPHTILQCYHNLDEIDLKHDAKCLIQILLVGNLYYLIFKTCAKVSASSCRV